MIKLKFFLLSFLVLMSLGFLFAQPLKALDCSSPNLSPKQNAQCAINATNPDGQTDSQAEVSQVLRTVLNILSLVIGIASVIVLLIQGLRLVLSSGNKETATQVRNSIIYVFVGLIIAASAQALVLLVLDKLE